MFSRWKTDAAIIGEKGGNVNSGNGLWGWEMGKIVLEPIIQEGSKGLPLEPQGTFFILEAPGPTPYRLPPIILLQVEYG
jgi:hypothetical protein